MSSRKADKETVMDRGESIRLMEPLLVYEGSRWRTELTDLAIELVACATGFRRSLPPGMLAELGNLVGAMNCYYSNLIEGHNTHPIDIERALKNEYSADPEKRNLQFEAKAHITVQKWIDSGGIGRRITTAESLCEIHRRFGELLPEELLWSRESDGKKRILMIPGVLRTRDVKVGGHIPVSPGALPRFLERFGTVYQKPDKTDAVLALAAAHHRFVWIHPFLDGNGRVARLMSHAMLLETLDTGGVWSISRGLARRESEYKAHLMACDAKRRNDLDGRGNLSEEALAGFTRFFLETCIDQVKFMEGLMQPARLHGRILTWVGEEIRTKALPAKSGRVLEAVLYRGELPRREVAHLLDTSERNASRTTSALLKREVLVSASSRAPLRLAFPAKLVSQWMPGLFPA